MKYSGTLIAVSDMDNSKRFYNDVLGLKVIADFGANVMLEGGVFLQTLKTWKEFIRKEEVELPNNACELYFEESDMDAFLEHLNQFDISDIPEPFSTQLGQRVVRFYDLDKLLLKWTEEIAMVLGILASGRTEEETADRMDVPID
jgi:catechol 2,3-dioxygenase-like lactoylglutathione lyase family enzyme